MTSNRIVIVVAVAGVLLATEATATTIMGAVTVRGGAPADAVVYLEGQVERPPVQPPPRLVMDQKDLAFVPGTLPVVRGTTVDFRNSDDVEHNVFSPSDVAKRFDLGTYRRGESRSVVFDQVGEVLILCNIHMEMAASILVLRDPFFARVDADGRYRIEGVPAGTYRLRLWRDGWLPHVQRVEVTEKGSQTVDVNAP
jgi:plastocyanin